jgi:hypothetical protein
MSSNYKYNDFQQIQILPLLKENKQISHKKQKQMSKVGYPYIIYLQYKYQMYSTSRWYLDWRKVIKEEHARKSLHPTTLTTSKMFRYRELWQ